MLNIAYIFIYVYPHAERGKEFFLRRISELLCFLED
jgi:hypothetical protein